jgi:2-polyprenyl-6-hydroxyphenyl methylase/3-demethylubiquinone-9 3-methyltransferase
MSASPNDLQRFYTGAYVANFPDGDCYGKLQKLLRYVTLLPQAKVADFGCANGVLLDYLWNRVAEYHGVDFAPEFIARAQQRAQARQIGNACFVCSTIPDFCQHYPNYFDHAFTFDVSEHVYDEEFLTIYAAIRSALKPGGTLYLHTPNADFLFEICRRRNLFFHLLPEHVAVRSAAQYQRLLTAVGFTRIQVLFVPHYVRLLSYLQLFSSLPVIGTYLRARLLLICEK